MSLFIDIVRQNLLVIPIMLPFTGAMLAAAFRGRIGGWISLWVSIVTLGIAGVILHLSVGDGPQVYQVGGWVPPYGIVLVADVFSAVLVVVTACVAVASALHVLVSGEGLLDRRLYHTMFLMLLAGLGGVFLTGDLFNLYVFMEMVILSSIALVALADKRVSAETTFKYAVLSAIGSLMLLIAIGLVYASVGTLNMADIAVRAGEGMEGPFWAVPAAMLLFAFLLKGAIFPFHFWQPDAHSAAPSAVSAMLSGVLVKVGFYGIARMVTLLFPDAVVLTLLVPLGAISAVFGGIAALANNNLKRMLAYSTIANMGFMLLALGWGGVAGYMAAVVNVANHALIKAGLFLSGGYVTERLKEQSMLKMGGMARLSPMSAIAFGIGAIALAGLPPSNGFLNKLTVLQAGLASGDYVFLSIAVVASAITIAYSLKTFVRVFWGKTPDHTVEKWRERDASGGSPLAPLLLAVTYLALGFWPGPLIAIASAAAGELSNPEIYINAVLGGLR